MPIVEFSNLNKQGNLRTRRFWQDKSNLSIDPRGLGPSIFLINRFLPEISITIWVRSLIDIISAEPMLIGTCTSDCTNLEIPSRHSSIYRKGLILFPVLYTSMWSTSVASATFLQIAAGAFSLPPENTPSGPNIL